MESFFSFMFRMLLGLVLCGVALAIFLTTPFGVNSVISAANHLLPGNIRVQGLQGRLWDSVSFKTLSYQDADIVVVLKQGIITRHQTQNSHFIRLNAVQARVNGIPLGQFKGTINAERELDATIRWQNQTWPLDATHTLISPTGHLNVKGRWPHLRLVAQGDLASPEHAKLKAQGSLNGEQVEGALTIDTPVINLLHEFKDLNQQVQAQGQLHATLAIQGTLSKPVLTGKLALSQGELKVPDAELILSPIQATLESQDKHWQIKAQFMHGNTPLTLAGNGEFYPELKGSLSLHGENMDVMHSSEYHIQASPDLTFTFKPDTYGLTGTILIPTASLKPMTFSNTVNLTDDAIFITHEKAATPLNLAMDIHVIMGQNVALDVKGLHGLLDGSIRVTQQPKQPLNASGTLSLREGRYKAYGQNLVINTSQLVFAGPSIDNPSIHMRAVRDVDQSNIATAGASQLFDFSSENLQNIAYGNHVKVGIDISGRLKSPKVTLFSNPPTLSQSDILSMLLLGKPANQASKSGGQLLVSAITALNLDSTSKGAALLQQLKSKLDLDFDFQNNANSSQGNGLKQGAAVGIGKSLTKRIYLHYTIDLFQDNSNVLTLTYLLNRFFSIQVSTNDIGNGIDLLYTHQGTADE